MELFSLVLGAVVMFATPGYIALQIGTVVSARSQGWRVAALVPLLFAVPIAAWCLFALVQDSNLWPLPFILFAGLCFSSLDATAKYLVRDHALFLVVWARYAGQMLVTTPIAFQRGGAGFWRTRHLRMQLARSLCLVIATACFFGGLRFLPLAEGTAVSFLAPMIGLLRGRIRYQ